MAKENSIRGHRDTIAAELRQAALHLRKAAEGMEALATAMPATQKIIKGTVASIAQSEANGYKLPAAVKKKVLSLQRHFEKTAAEIHDVPVTRQEKAQAKATKAQRAKFRAVRAA